VAVKMAAAEVLSESGNHFQLPASLSSTPTSSSSLKPNCELSSVAQRHYLSSMRFEAAFGSELRKKITNIVYNRKPTYMVKKANPIVREI